MPTVDETHPTPSPWGGGPDRGVIVALGLAGVAMPLLLLAGPGAPANDLPWPLVLVAAAALCLLGPGWLLVDAFLPRRAATDVLERMALVLGAGFAHLILAGLLLHDLPGPITANRLVALHGVALLVYAAAAWRRGAHGRPRSVVGRTWAQVALVLLLAAGLRLPHVGWSEFQGDEAIVLTKAAAAVEGRDDAHYIHKKGPAEILVTAQVYALQGRVDETRARLPFALATLAGLLALFVVGRGLFGGVAATIATLALGLNGFFIAFARIVQYQGVVFLMSMLALWCFLRLRGARDEGVAAPVRAPNASLDVAGEADRALDERDAPAWILLAALLLAAGLLAHYDAGLVAPALLWLLLRRWRSTPGAWRRDLPWVGAATVLGTVLLGAFYVPLARHPYFQTTTLPYLIEVRLGGGDEARGMFHNTLRNSATLATFYSAALVMLAWSVALGAEVVRRLRAWLPAGGGWLTSAIFLLGSAAILVRPEWFQWGALNGTILFVGAVALAGLLARGPGDGWKAVWLWLVVPFLFYATVVESPRTHFHTTFPAWSILLALPIAAAWQWGGAGRAAGDDARALLDIVRPWARPIVMLIGLGLYGYGARYAYHAFLDRAVEYKRGWPETRLAGSWIPYPDLPSSGWFGFPYRAGWKTVGALYDGGALAGDYDSNEEQPVTGWYTRGRTRCDVLPRYVFQAEDVQDIRPIPEDLPAAGYVPVGEVMTMGRARIAIWERTDARVGGLGASGVASAPLRYVDPATVIGDGALNAAGDSGDGGDVASMAAPSSSVAGSPFGSLVDGFAATFDRQASGPAFERHLPYGDPLTYAPNPIDIDLGGQARLRGWQIEGADSATAGGWLMLSLWWQATAPMDTDYSVFAHIELEGEITVGQHDGSPGARDAKGVCGAPRPTTAWQPGEVVVDRRVIQIARDAPPGDYPLLVGLYDYESLERLEILDEMGNPAGNRVELTTVRVGPGVSGDAGAGIGGR